MSEDQKICPTCEQRIKPVKAYWHTLSVKLAQTLQRFYIFANYGSKNLNRCNFDYSARANFQKLQYWNFIERGEKSGEWRITKDGIDFLFHNTRAARRVMTVSGRVMRRTNEMVSFAELQKSANTKWQTADDYKPIRLKKKYDE